MGAIVETKEFELSADDLFVFCQNALVSINYSIGKNNIAIGHLEASGVTKRRQVRFEIETTPLDATKASVHVEAYSSNLLGTRAPFSGTKGPRQALDDFWAMLEKIIHRAKTQYG